LGILILAVLFAGFTRAADTPVREVQSECPVISNGPVCEFRNGRFFSFEESSGPNLRAYRPDGRLAFTVSVQTRVSDVAVDSDGSLAVAVGSGIALLKADGTQTAFVDTKPLVPAHIAIGADHSIWVLGSEPGSQPGNMILRRYTRDGRLVGSYLNSGSEGSPTSLMAAGNKIAVVPGSQEVIELDESGTVLGRMRLDNSALMQFALTSDGNLYGWDATLMPYGGLVLLDPVKGTSKKLETPGRHYSLIGADGNNLVYREPDGGPGDGMKAAWFPQPGKPERQ
jgi:hypothetical protein